MTRIEKLDRILIGLTSAKSDSQESEQPGTGYFFKNCCDILKIPLEEGEDKILEGILLADGYIDYTDKKLKLLIDITAKGIDFINKEGYQKLQEEKIQEQNKKKLELKLTESILETNKWTKRGIATSIIISIIALVISIISLIQNKN